MRISYREIQEMRIKIMEEEQAACNISYEKGKKEGLEFAAKGMLAKKISTEIITKITGLTYSQLKALQWEKYLWL